MAIHFLIESIFLILFMVLGIEHMAEEERSSRSQATTDSEDDFEFNTKQPTPDEILAAADAK